MTHQSSKWPHNRELWVDKCIQISKERKKLWFFSLQTDLKFPTFLSGLRLSEVFLLWSIAKPLAHKHCGSEGKALAREMSAPKGDTGIDLLLADVYWIRTVNKVSRCQRSYGTTTKWTPDFLVRAEGPGLFSTVCVRMYTNVKQNKNTTWLEFVK